MVWIQIDSLATSALRVPSMGDAVHFSDKGYAQVNSETATILANAQQVSGISVLDSAPSDPGVWDDASDQDTQEITITLSDHDTFGDLTIHGTAMLGGETITSWAEAGGSGDSGTLSEEQVYDFVAGFLSTGANVTLTADDGTNTLTLDAIHRSDESIQDLVGSLITAGANTTVTYEDGTPEIRIDSVDTVLSDADVLAALDGADISVTSLTATDVSASNSITLGGDTITAWPSGGGGGSSWTVPDAPVTSATTASDSDALPVDASGGAVEITLPAASPGVAVRVKKIDSTANAVTVVTPGDEQIDGNPQMEFTTPQAFEYVADASNYYVF